MYMVYRGVDGANIWASMYDGNTWSRQINVTKLNTARTSEAPTMAPFDDRLYAIYRGDGSSNIWSFWYDGEWSSKQVNLTEITKAQSSTGVSTVGDGLSFRKHFAYGSA